jgi:hypothetical protein
MMEIEFRVFSKEAEEMIPWENMLEAPDLVAFLQSPKENGYYSELMQFTGRHDINDKEVYEGDILKCKDLYTGLEFSGTVDFQDCSFVIKDDFVTHYRWMDYEIEVVGNIWDDEQKGGE